MALLFESPFSLFDAYMCGGPSSSYCRRPCSSSSRAVLVKESDDAYTIRANVPGASADSVALKVRDDGVLSLSVKDVAGTRTLVKRTFALPDDADPSEIRSACVNGVLEINVKKVAKPAPVDVPVSDAHLPPLVDGDDNKPYELRRNVPGVGAKDITLRVEDSILSGSATSSSGGYRFEYTLPADAADANTVVASCVHGVLTVRVPRRAAPAPVSVPVSDTLPAADGEEDGGVQSLARMHVPGYGAEHATVEVVDGTLRVRLEKDGVQRQALVALPDTVKHYEHIRAGVQSGVLRVWCEKAGVCEPAETQLPVASQPMGDEEAKEGWHDVGADVGTEGGDAVAGGSAGMEE